MKYLPVLLLLACGFDPHGWVVTNATAEQESEALALVDIARNLTGAALPYGEIDVVTKPFGLDGWCGSGGHISGCTWGPVIGVLVMPDRGLGPDLIDTALPHELGHVTGARTEDEATKTGQMIVALYLLEQGF